MDKETMNLVINGKWWNDTAWGDMHPWRTDLGPVRNSSPLASANRLTQDLYTGGGETYDVHLFLNTDVDEGDFVFHIGGYSKILTWVPGDNLFEFTTDPIANNAQLSFSSPLTGSDERLIFMNDLQIIGIPFEWPPYDLAYEMGLSPFDSQFLEFWESDPLHTRYRFAHVASATNVGIKFKD